MSLMKHEVNLSEETEARKQSTLVKPAGRIELLLVHFRQRAADLAIYAQEAQWNILYLGDFIALTAAKNRQGDRPSISHSQKIYQQGLPHDA